MKILIELWFNSIFNFAKLLTIFYKKIEFGAVQKDVNLVDLEKCCKMSIYLQNLASIQPRTSLGKSGVRGPTTQVGLSRFKTSPGVPSIVARFGTESFSDFSAK